MNIPNPRSSNPPQPPASFETIDAILSHHARSLQPGQSIAIPLYKSTNGTITSIDPLQAARASKAAAAIGAKTIARSVQERSSVKFPRVMKFIETVEDPDFGNGKGKVETFRDGRLYVEDIPKAKDDSDDDEDAEGAEGTSSSTKRKRWRRNQPPKQQWVLQPKNEFLHKFQAKQMRSKDPAAAALLEKQLNEKLSKRYHGREEANSSAYVILGAGDVNVDQTLNTGLKNNAISNVSISVMPMHGYTNFTQPAKFHTLSMQEAEQALNTQSGLSRYMMHGGNSSATNSSHISTATGGDAIAARRKRLLGKFGRANDDENDVMTDLCFRESSSSRSSTTMLLSDVGDGDVKIDADGILGGANDGEFGGKRRFGRMSNIKADDTKASEGSNKRNKNGERREKNNNNTGTGASVAMTDDFYHRDVGAEYNELDFDANELFDDDDVDVGAEEMLDGADMGGFAADIDDDEDDDSELDDDDVLDGFASTSGLKAMIAKASGENTEGLVPNAISPNGVPPVLPLITKKTGPLSDTNMSSGSDRSDDENKAKINGGNGNTSGLNEDKDAIASAAVHSTNANGVQLDENGLRIITREAIRREIWLHNGSIETKKLARTYKISGKTAKERKQRFFNVCRELCNMSNGMLTLKQHFRKMD
uniref:Transcription initiation factor IIF subunit alpha n=1 Tax=Chaetoceros debilis TaxID=122233 RepID=A0A7S3PU53_9STRA|mmetsp:Transcript_3158/g.4641  ORF Transcript_3158/g.4641 Transcript_3158/m.4641 type:complete len:650 (+) Transcript_3158:44-1993(+)